MEGGLKRRKASWSEKERKKEEARINGKSRRKEEREGWETEIICQGREKDV